MGKKKKIADRIWTVVLTILALLYVYPIIMILFNLLKKETTITTAGAFTLPTADGFAGLENYVNAIASKGFLQSLGYREEELARGGIPGISRKIRDYKKMAEEVGVGEITLRDIAGELEKPARDPRDEMPRPVLRSDILEMKDLKPGMILKGTVRNVIDFGVFVDIGVHQDGLVHISQITDRYIKHPLEAVSVGDIVDVQVLTVDVAKKRIGLTMKIQKQ